MPYTNDSKPSGSYSNEDTTALVSWADSEISWASPYAGWAANVAISLDSKPTGSYSNDNKPS